MINMQDRNEQSPRQGNSDELAGRSHGMQGVDKAPGEETNQDNVQFQQETQKGKKVDADLEREEDRPLENQQLED
jgi:hypothetical protein